MGAESYIFKCLSNKIIRLLSIVILTYIIVVPLKASDVLSSGLTFKSHSVLREQRTSLQLNKGKFIQLSNGFSLEFDVKFREELYNYGYVFRIIAGDKFCYDLLSNFTKTSKELSLVESNNTNHSLSFSLLKKYKLGDWAHIRFQIYPNKASLCFNGYEVNIKCEYPSTDKFKFYFGIVDAPSFTTTDVPTITLRNIRLTNNKNKVIGFWPLDMHSHDIVYDSVSAIPAKVINPIWEIDSHTKWKKIADTKLSTYTQSAYDAADDCFYFANKDLILKYKVKDNHFDTIHTKGGNPFIEKYNQLIFHPYKKELWSYDFDKSTLSVYNFRNNTWSQSDLALKNPDFSQHNVFVSPIDSGLYVFGGYGNYTYKNKLLKKKDDQADWKEINYKPLIPNRYFSGLGFLSKDNVLIFGGYGNKKGIQELGTYHYYDLYLLNLKNFKAKKCWELQPNKDNYVVGSSLVYFRKLNVFFALCFSNARSNCYLQLRSFDLKDGKNIIYGDTIPLLFDDVKSYTTLYLNGDSTTLYALSSYNHDNYTSIKVYSMSFPPLTNKQVIQENSSLAKIFISIAVFFLSFLLIIYFRKFFRKVPSKNSLDTKQYIKANTFAPVIKSTKSAILILGGFHVWGRNGEEITDKFTPILAQLFFLILLYSKKNDNGISNSMLREFLWADKDDESFLNNRRVSIHKLKSLLENLDGVSLEKNNMFWSIKFSNKAFCDYYYVVDFMNNISNQQYDTIQNILDFQLEIMSETLLPDTQKCWLDDFKADFSNKVLDTLTTLSQLNQLKINNDILIQISNIMLTHDRTDEYALALKCKAFVNSGKISLAKSVYNSFCIEYKNMLGVKYPKEFKDICS